MKFFAFASRWVPLGLLLLAVGLAPAGAQPAVRLHLHSEAVGAAIPEDFAGLSYETNLVLRSKDGRHLFRPENRQLTAVMGTLGIHSLRLGGNTSDLPSQPLPQAADLDPLFQFARAAKLKVIFTLRLRQGDPSAAAEEARYLWAHYSSEIAYFAIGNEPDVYDHTYPAYLADLRKYIGVITQPGVAPAARFAGPSTTPDKADWARSLAQDSGSLPVRMITQHAYPGGSARAIKTPGQGIDEMLSPEWIAGYEAFYTSFGPSAQQHHLPYRLEETNSYYHGGVPGASDSMAAALWALDYLHWWAVHRAAGLNFHTGDWVAAADDLTRCRYAAFWSSPAGYTVLPVGYALTAFAQGSQGRIVPVEMVQNPAGVNLTAYAVLASDGRVLVTLINKEHGARARSAKVSLTGSVSHAQARAMLLTAPGADAAATSGLQLGGAGIMDDGSWQGRWAALPAAANDSDVNFTLPPATAAVIALR